ncbi:serine hydrolase domain-containing protein [Pseudoflavitalea rhizosphaerae]|uniref:serine hydrolase domain-containing protein n=1 Tax=Pseudoflavitalea rhizosphaerae TaxID=1884793 RepID=UPI000F8D4E7C|nr:serine hydrolase domain-containing protein [Pseudoflavitalea rhizosphaerae]
MAFRLFSFLLAIGIGVVAYSQEPISNPEKLNSWIDEHAQSMGGRAILVIYKDGKLIYNYSANEMTRRQKMAGKWISRKTGTTANTSDYTLQSKTMIASCSKWLSAALVMTFIDEGKLSLNDSVGKFLPVLSNNGKGQITIQHCLSHLTGIKEPPLQESLKAMKKFKTMDESIEWLAKMPMEGKPGTVFHYSNAGLQIAGAVLEKISGKNFETLFAERIAKPLRMNNTDFGEGPVALPAGGASSTPQDYLNFLSMILNKGSFEGQRILSEKSIREMQVNRIQNGVRVAYAPAEAGSFGYGSGEWVMEEDTMKGFSKTVTSPGLFGSFPWVDNQKKYCAFLMTFYLKNEGRNQRYKELKALVDTSIR